MTVLRMVEHPQRPEWGPGRVVAVSDERLHVFFRDALETKAKVILTNLVTLKVCESQEDAALDAMPAAKFDGQDWVLPKTKPSKSKKAAAAAAQG